MERAAVDPYGTQKPAEKTGKKFQLVEGSSQQEKYADAVNSFFLTLPFHLGMLETDLQWSHYWNWEG